jgi:hypothetical protein
MQVVCNFQTCPRLDCPHLSPHDKHLIECKGFCGAVNKMVECVGIAPTVFGD